MIRLLRMCARNYDRNGQTRLAAIYRQLADEMARKEQQ